MWSWLCLHSKLIHALPSACFGLVTRHCSSYLHSYLALTDHCKFPKLHFLIIAHRFLIISFSLLLIKDCFFLQICLVCADTGKTTSVFRDNQIHSSMLKHNHVHNYLSLPRSGKCERWRGRLHSLCSLSVTNVDNSQTLNKLGLEWCYSYPQPLLYSFVNETHIVKLDWLEWSCMMISTTVEPYSNGHSCLLLHFQ